MKKEDEQQEEKEDHMMDFTGYLMLNWRSGSMRILKKKPDRVNYTDIPVKVNIKVLVPKDEEIHVKGEVRLSQAQMNEMVLERI